MTKTTEKPYPLKLNILSYINSLYQGVPTNGFKLQCNHQCFKLERNFLGEGGKWVGGGGITTSRRHLIYWQRSIFAIRQNSSVNLALKNKFDFLLATKLPAASTFWQYCSCLKIFAFVCWLEIHNKIMSCCIILPVAFSCSLTLCHSTVNFDPNER